MKKRFGFHKSVWEGDKTGLPPKSGYLRKRATNGSWQKRFFKINNEHLNYYASSKADVVKASINLRTVVDSPYLVDRFGEFVLELGDDEHKYRLRAESVEAAKEWMDALDSRRDYFMNEEEASITKPRGESTSSQSTRATGSVVSMPSTPIEAPSVMASAAAAAAGGGSGAAAITQAAKRLASLRKEGVLEKCSPSRFKAWQERYFKLINGSMYYFKSAKVADADYLGEIVIDDTCVIERIDNRGFHIRTRFRTYVLQAPSARIREEWVDELLALQDELRAMEQRMIHEATQEEQRRLAAMREKAHQPPEWILKFDKREQSANVELIQGMLRERFRDCTGDLMATINVATSLIEEVDDMARECLPSMEGHGEGGKLTEAGRTPRVDVFATCLREYHISLVNEISQLCSSERLDGTSSQGLLRLVDLIRAYGDKLQEVMIDPLRKHLGCVLGSQDMGNVPAMAALYIDRLLTRLGTWVDEIVTANLAAPTGTGGNGNDHDQVGESRVKIRANGLVSTPAPIDLFNMVNETLAMVVSSGVEDLSAEALSTCLTTVSDYLHITMDHVEDQHSAPLSCAMLCALANDCWLVGEQLDALETSQAALMEYSGISFDNVHELYNEAALALLSRVADIVFSDLRTLNDQLFSRKHLYPESDELIHNVMARIAATVEEYLVDLGRMLEPPYVIRVAKLCAGRCAASYCGQLLKNVMPATRGLKSVFGGVSPRDTSGGICKADETVLERLRDDVVRLHTCFDALAGELFVNETCLLDDILELLTVSPDFIPMTLRAICERESPAVHATAVFVTECVVRLREDITAAEAGEVLVECKNLISKMKASSTSRTTATAPVATHSYSLLSSFLPPGTLPRVAVMQANRKEEPLVVKNATWTTATASSSRAYSLAADVSYAASQQRRASRMASVVRGVAAAEQDGVAQQQQKAMESDVVDLSGYLEKKNQTGLWKRRWFVVRQMFDKGTGTWPQALAWHKDHSSAPKSHLFVNDVISVIPSVSDGLQSHGSTLELMADTRRKKKTDSEREFRVVCKGRVFVLRARSVHEMLTWVNGLRRACVRNVPRPGNSPPLKSGRHELKNLSLKGLRALGIGRRGSASSVSPNSFEKTKNALLQLVEDGANYMEGSSSATGPHGTRTANLRNSFNDGGSSSSSTIRSVSSMGSDSGGERSVQEQHDLANDAWTVERRRIVGSRTMEQLRDACKRENISTEGYDEKHQLVDLVLEHIHDNRAGGGSSSSSGGGDVALRQRQHETDLETHDGRSRVDSVALELSANIMSMVRMGHEYVEQSNYFEAVAMFDKAAREARQLDNKLFEAHAMAGLGCAYNATEERASAAPMMFEMAANLYKDAGETSCYMSTLIDAANAFANQHFYDEALRCLTSGGGKCVPILAKKMDEIKAMTKSSRR